MFWNDLPNFLFDLTYVSVAQFKPGSARALDVHDKLARIGSWEVGFPKQGIKCEHQRTRGKNSNRADNRPQNRPIYESNIFIQHQLEFLVKSAHDPLED